MKRWQIIIGIFLLLWGVSLLLNQIFPGLQVGRFIGPLILIGIGVLLILRPRIVGPGVQIHVPVLGDIRKTGPWSVTQHEYWWFVGSIRLDFTEAVFPEGDAVVKIFGFVNDITIILPDDVGLRVDSTGFLTEYKGLAGKQERFLNPLEDQSHNYFEIEKRVNVQSFAFVSEIKVRPGLL